jgi:hypothetical protein
MREKRQPATGSERERVAGSLWSSSGVNSVGRRLAGHGTRE